MAKAKRIEKLQHDFFYRRKEEKNKTKKGFICLSVRKVKEEKNKTKKGFICLSVRKVSKSRRDWGSRHKKNSGTGLCINN